MTNMTNIAFKTRDAFLLNHLKLQMSVVVPTLNGHGLSQPRRISSWWNYYSHIELSAHSNSFVLN